MPEDHSLPRRRSVRLTHFDYSQSARYFLTICSQGRRPVFSKVSGTCVELSPLGHIVDLCWTEIPSQFSQVELGPRVVMPDHIHGIVIIRERSKGHGAKAGKAGMPTDGGDLAKDGRQAPAPGGCPLPTDQGVREFGSSVAGSVATIVATFKAAVSRKLDRQIGRPKSSLWQRGYYEHVIRDEQDFANACAYIRSNPARSTFERDFPWKLKT